MQQYVVGFLFDDHAKTVLLIEKQRPEWQKGKLNGVGGKIEGEESPRMAMTREFEEETGVEQANWQHFASLGDAESLRFRVYFYFALNTRAISEAVSTTDEKLVLVDLEKLSSERTVPNLQWLIPMAINMRSQPKIEAFNILEVYRDRYATILTDVHLLEQTSVEGA